VVIFEEPMRDQSIFSDSWSSYTWKRLSIRVALSWSPSIVCGMVVGGLTRACSEEVIGVVSGKLEGKDPVTFASERAI
jgi:hypothetical protein